MKPRFKTSLKCKTRIIVTEAYLGFLYFPLWFKNMLCFCSLSLNRANSAHNLQLTLSFSWQKYPELTKCYAKVLVYPKAQSPLPQSQQLLKLTYGLESLSGKYQFVFTDDTVPLDSAGNLLQHFQPERRNKIKRSLFLGSRRVHNHWKVLPTKSETKSRTKDSIPVSIKGFIAEANAGVDQCWTTVNREKIFVWIKTGSSASSVTKHRITAMVTVTTTVHFYSWKVVLSWPLEVD